MKNSKVKVTKSPEGLVIVPSVNSPERGYVRVEQTIATVNAKGFLSNHLRSALIKAELSTLESMGFFAGQELPGKIVVREGFEPLNPKDVTYGIKLSGPAQIPCVADGQPIYRESQYTDNLGEADILVEHTNGEEIKAANAAMVAEGADLAAS